MRISSFKLESAAPSLKFTVFDRIPRRRPPPKPPKVKNGVLDLQGVLLLPHVDMVVANSYFGNGDYSLKLAVCDLVLRRRPPPKPPKVKYDCCEGVRMRPLPKPPKVQVDCCDGVRMRPPPKPSNIKVGCCSRVRMRPPAKPPWRTRFEGKSFLKWGSLT